MDKVIDDFPPPTAERDRLACATPPDDGPSAAAAPKPAPAARRAGLMLYTADGNLRRLWEIEGEVIRLAVVVYRGRMAEIARRLGIGRSTLYRKLAEHGIANPGDPADHDR